MQPYARSKQIEVRVEDADKCPTLGIGTKPTVALAILFAALYALLAAVLLGVTRL